MKKAKARHTFHVIELNESFTRSDADLPWKVGDMFVVTRVQKTKHYGGSYVQGSATVKRVQFKG